MTLRFEGSDSRTVGMEMELQLLDEQSWDLVDGVLPLLELYPGSERVKPEFIQNTVEVASPPCADVAELGTEMDALVTDLAANCRRLGYRLCSAGTHPFSLDMASITPLPRYLAIGKAGGYLGHNQITYATHIHVGLRDGDEAVRLMSLLKPYLPLLIALSANSPYWRAEDTRFAAFRHRILAPSRTYGLPPDFDDWHDFEHFYATMLRAQRIETINDIHWDIRPRPHLGTLEVRVMDAQTRLADALALAALVRALVSLLRQRPGTGPTGADPALPADLPWWAHKDNCYVASRDGLDALLIADDVGHLRSAQDLVAATLDAAQAHAADVGEAHHIELLRARAAAGGLYAEQRELHRRHGNLPAVVEALSDALVAPARQT